MQIRFHHLLKIRFTGSRRRLLDLIVSEYPNFIVPESVTGEADLEVFFGPFDEEALGSKHPFFHYRYGAGIVSETKRYKTAKWKVALSSLDNPPARLHFDGNRSSEIFFIGEILEPLLRYLLVRKGALLLHSSCVATPAGSVLISGIRHTGKTLLMMEALARGASLLSDDYTFVSAENEAFCYPKKVNLFVTHFCEIESLKEVWNRLPLADRLRMRFFNFVRRVTRDYMVLGYQKFLTELLPQVTIQNSAPLKKIVLLTRQPTSAFAVRRNLDPRETAAKLAANNQWECNTFQRMLLAYRYGNPTGGPSEWIAREEELLATIASRTVASEIVIPDFSPDNLHRLLSAAREEIFE